MTSSKIPKKIHYCWFGKREKPEIINRCIKSWTEKLIGYEIIEWNESNFDINSNKFVKQAYEAKKFAFVSDYVRVYVLYKYGGIYLDTDVEVYKDFSEDILSNSSFWGFEEKNYIATSTIGACKNSTLIKKLLDSYDNKEFLKADGSIDITTNVSIVTEIIEKLGVKLDGSYQKIEGVATIYPQEYFSPYDYINCYSKENNNTYTIHHYYKSWLPIKTRIKSYIKKSISNIFGGKNISKIREMLNKR